MRVSAKIRHVREQVAILLCLPALFITTQAPAAEFLLFPSVGGLSRSDDSPELKRHEPIPELDFFYAVTQENLRFLAEYSAQRDSHEMERLLLGWKPNPENTLWLGRYHSPLGYWATEFHHGAYLQTSITPPGIAFDDEGGPFPTHPSGWLFEGQSYRENASVNYALGLGIGPVMLVQLEPLNILDPEDQKGRLAASARLSYRPHADGRDEIGVFAGHTKIPVMNRSVSEVAQTLTGVFFNTTPDRLRLFGEVFWAENRLSGVSSAGRDHFVSAYLQGEYQVQSAWTLFGRLENTSGGNGDAYLNMLPAFVHRRSLGGVRYEVARNQALKLELSRNRLQNGIQFAQVGIQWSMVLP